MSKKILCSAFALLGFSGLAFAATLQGHVVLPNASPVSGAVLTLQSTGAQVTTDAQGAFSFTSTTMIKKNFELPPAIGQKNGMVMLDLPKQTAVDVAIYSAIGASLGKPMHQIMPAGEYNANPILGVREAGVYFVRVQAGNAVQSFKVMWKGGNSTPMVNMLSGNQVLLAKAAGALDAIAVRISGDSIGESQVYIASGTLPNIVLVHRTLSGVVTTNGNTVSSLLINGTTNNGLTAALDPDWNATTGAFTVTEPWRIVDSTATWTSIATVTTSTGATKTGTAIYTDKTSAVDFGVIVLSSITASSSSAISSSAKVSSSSAAVSSSVKVSSSSVAVSSSAKVSSSSVAVSSSAKISSSSVAVSSSAVVSSSSAISTTPPAELQYSINWVWENRIKDVTEVNALGSYNFNEDKIMEQKGELHVCMRWESKVKITKAQRDKFEPMINRVVNGWTKWLKGYDGFPYDTVKVKIVGWSVIDYAYLDTTGISVPVYKNGSLTLVNGSFVDGLTAPYCPSECSRDYYYNGARLKSTYASCKSPNQHFESVVWGTDGFVGGAGTEGGGREDSQYLIDNLDGFPHILAHEYGHGFSFPDFYNDATDCPDGNCANLPLTIMNAGASMVITDWDGWMLRRAWTEMKNQTPARW